MTGPLIDMQGIWREYDAGDEKLAVLKGIDLQIYSGEMVAIMGTSGSGKSTLMNIMGCLDRATRGSYKIADREVSKLSSDAVATLRRSYFGFIFQRYNLLAGMNALHNVEMPAVYDGLDAAARRSRAEKLLQRLGLGARMSHMPGQMSGGQQQRVGIARALMNGAAVILADEPTGALDTKSGREVMALLKELNAEGYTIVMVTHDPKVATEAERVIHIRDGEIISDRRTKSLASRTINAALTAVRSGQGGWRDFTGRFGEIGRMAFKSMSAHRLRAFLTMLGIMIGIASVVSVVAMGHGAQKKIMESISSLGVDVIQISPKYMPTGQAQTMMPSDYALVRRQSYVDKASPVIDMSLTARYGRQTENATITGVGEDFASLQDYKIINGVFFGVSAVDQKSQQAVIDKNTQDKMFGREDPIGKTVFLGDVPVRIVGVMTKKSFVFGSQGVRVWIPYSTAQTRFTGQRYIDGLTVRVASGFSASSAEKDIIRLLTQRHGVEDFTTSNSEDWVNTIKETRRTTTLLISSIALISLLVGGIGVMNIMLVAVVERTREIGIRMAVGARQHDIMQQFLIEAVIVCMMGGMLGIALALGGSAVFSAAGKDFDMIFSADSIIAAFGFSCLIGLAFGFLPARSAARLDPVEALSRE